VIPPRPLVHIHYRRPPDREEVFVQHLIRDAPDVKITLAEDVPFDPPIQILGEVALEKGSTAIWFTFPGRWHDVGRFHRANGTFTGIYANILTPPVIHPGNVWETTDLFLDVWVDLEGRLSVLDEDQFRDAVARGWVTPREADMAVREVERIRREHEARRWPPEVVGAWTLERVRRG
jgi:predicted RNA-binding protein associated with RNAse of E/G family